MFCEGSRIRGIERMTGVHRDTIMRLGVRLGEGCKRIMDDKMQNLDCRQIQVDEIWGFMEMKPKTAKHVRAGPEAGDVWTWIAIDAETKVVPTFAVGDRTQYMRIASLKTSHPASLIASRFPAMPRRLQRRD